MVRMYAYVYQWSHWAWYSKKTTFIFIDILRPKDTDNMVSDTMAQNDNNQASKYYLELALTAEQAIANKYGNDTSDILLVIANIVR